MTAHPFRRSSRLAAVVLLHALATPALVEAGGPCLPSPQIMTETLALSADQLVRMTPAQLDALYAGAVPMSPPAGPVRGTALMSPGTRMAPIRAKAARVLWQGKIFDPEDATAINRFFGARMIRGRLFHGPSLFDGRPSLILDYQGTSFVYRKVRDEIRQVAPGLYLGRMYRRTSSGPRFRMYFVLEG